MVLKVVNYLYTEDFQNVARIYSKKDLCDLNKFEEGTEVTPELLFEMGIIKKQLSGIKVLGNGELTKKLTVRAHKFSSIAKEKIEAAGGKAEVI